MWKEFKLAFSYTLETSCHGYLDSERVTQEFTQKNLQKLGAMLAATHYEYLELKDEEARVKEERRMKRLKKKKRPLSSNVKSLSPERVIVKDKKRTLQDVIKSIKKEEKVESESSSSSESEEDETEDNQLIKTSIVNLLDSVYSLCSYPAPPKEMPTHNRSPRKICTKPKKKSDGVLKTTGERFFHFQSSCGTSAQNNSLICSPSSVP